MENFTVPDHTLPLLLQYMAEIAAENRLDVVQENKYYSTSTFARMPFYKPVSLLYSPPMNQEGYEPGIEPKQ